MKNKIVLNRHSELPLQDDRANLFLEIMTTIAVFLFTLTLAGYLLLGTLVQNLDNGISSSLTVQIKPTEKTLDKEQERLRINQVIQFFENRSEVDKVMLISSKDVQRLMSPWLGTEIDVAQLPVPQLLDIRLKDGQEFDYEQATIQLAEIAPYASIDNHRVWLGRLLNVVGALQALGVGILLMMLIVCAFSILYAAQTSLGIHRYIIEILHIMGAKDDYIARQYAQRSFWIGAFSGITGTVWAIIALWLMGNIAEDVDSGILSDVSLHFQDWLMLLSLPFLTAILSMITAYFTVKRTLRKIM